MQITRSPKLLSFVALSAAMSFSTNPKLQAALACIVYISEGRDAAVLQRLETAASECEGVQLASLFVDEPYHRSNFCLVGCDAERLASAATLLSKTALSLLDLRQHGATHPRLGVVDHISCHPLGSLDAGAAAVAGGGRSSPPGSTGLHQAAGLARSIGEQLGVGEPAVPVFLYAAAHPWQQQLADIRRALGYFKGASQGQWAGPLPSQLPSPAGASPAAEAAAAALPLRPSYGPLYAQPRSGVCCIGASPCIVNFNMLLHGVGFKAAQRIAKSVSERGGGLKHVQAMALHHAQGVEIACNLLDYQVSSPLAVEARVAKLAAAEGGSVASSYTIGKPPEELLAIAQEL